ncbi:MAG: hypothetical protein LUC30_05540 [Clostridiales bacterium]|nr:hypothetical protein [Clostridiales bacterium]
MLRLKNVIIKNKTGEADFYPEQEECHGHILVDIESGNILRLDNAPGYEMIYPSHAAQALCTMARQNDARKERYVMWY